MEHINHKNCQTTSFFSVRHFEMRPKIQPKTHNREIMFSQTDLAQIKKLGIEISEIENQLENFKSGFPFADIQAPATVGDGVLRLENEQLQQAVSSYDNSISDKDILKFVPASGAASRMFKHLFTFMKEYDGSEKAYEKFTSDVGFNSVHYFFKKLNNFAFYEDLKKTFGDGNELEETHLKKEYVKLLSNLLNKNGLDYGSLPKGLLKFHSYENGSRTPLEEHLVEGAAYAKGKGNVAKLHFTVSPEHKEKFTQKVTEVQNEYEKMFDAKFETSYSEQKKSTDTIAVDMENNPFREPDNSILFRPGGHGALLSNLNEQDADIVFVKNIDNIVPDKLKPETKLYKKALAGILLDYQTRIFKYLSRLESEGSDELIAEISSFLENELCQKYEGFNLLGKEEKLSYLKDKLNRPIRVCGMVKNEGEPGGGPFWVTNSDGSLSLQIVESAQIDMDDSSKTKIMNESSHFNPVDLICGLKDYKGNKFDLMKFRDPKTGFIALKSKYGKDLKAQELPGLWNGAMANWNTVFVEVPVSTFNPVKTVNDLLREQHQCK
jgi:hypothetical protein